MSTATDVATAVRLLGSGREEVALRRLYDVMDSAPAINWDAYPDSASAPRPGDLVYVHAYGRQRRGIAVRTGRTKVLVAYLAPSNPGVMRVTHVPFNHATKEPVQ